jgi:hypothetical protein
VWDNFTEADLVVEENSNILAFGKATPGKLVFEEHIVSSCQEEKKHFLKG